MIPDVNVKLFRRIQHYIKQEPKRFLMSAFGITARTQREWERETMWMQDASEEIPPCGTASCIAGTANLLTGGKRLKAPIRAAKKLGISRGQSNSLFYLSTWPLTFQRKWFDAKTPEKRADIACARIDYFLETGT